MCLSAHAKSGLDSPMHRYRSHTCGALREADIGQDVRLSGWCHRIRDHGGVLFIDLRDHYGLTQVVADPDSKAFKLAETERPAAVGRGSYGSCAAVASPPGNVSPRRLPCVAAPRHGSA